jgi:hypothetical protein
MIDKIEITKILKNVDDLLSFNPVFTFSNLVYGGLISTLFSLIFIGIRLKLLEGYFQYMIFAVMFVFCIREANRHFSKLSGLWLVVGIGVFIHYLLAMIGYNTAILQAMIKFSAFLIIISITYHLGFRKYLIKKFRLTKREVLELKQNQE